TEVSMKPKTGKQRRRTRTRGAHQRNNPNRMLRGFECLEMRTLLSADMMSILAKPATSLGLDLLLRANNKGDKLQLVDLNNRSKVIHERDPTPTSPVAMPGSAAADRLQIDFRKPCAYQGEIHFDATSGQDEVQLDVRHLDQLSFSGALAP